MSITTGVVDVDAVVGTAAAIEMSTEGPRAAQDRGARICSELGGRLASVKTKVRRRITAKDSRRWPGPGGGESD